MNSPQITARGLLTVLAIAACIGTLGFIDNQKREIIKIEQEISKCRN